MWKNLRASWYCDSKSSGTGYFAGSSEASTFSMVLCFCGCAATATGRPVHPQQGPGQPPAARHGHASTSHRSCSLFAAALPRAPHADDSLPHCSPMLVVPGRPAVCQQARLKDRPRCQLNCNTDAMRWHARLCCGAGAAAPLAGAQHRFRSALKPCLHQYPPTGCAPQRPLALLACMGP